ncbi:hypothetical protein QVD17_12512 [Tagetes erecta]|uniref:RING-type domain-containing protein n=1 Tax=Tagetes erecta TaxID=13708 RepID=A0AAD8KVR4_TARER|nr:hypothetical protein QVD17_12512 [Tagetes erecta]
MMMMIMIASLVDSITTPMRLWLDKWGEKRRMRVKVVVSYISGVECIVCLSEVGLGEGYAMVERCGHGFHVECLEAWLKLHPNCPLCRTSAALDDDYKYIVNLKHIIIDTWLTTFFTLQSTLSESCAYL